MAANKREKAHKDPGTRRNGPREDRPRRGEPATGIAQPARPIERETPEPERRVYLPGAIAVVHEDADIIVVDKPAGLLTAGMPGEDVPSVFRAVKARVRDQARRRGTQVWIVHRLDKEASGLLVFAKTEKAFVWLKEEFRTKRAHRLYAAVVEGEVGPTGEGTIQNYLVEDSQGIVHEAATPMGGVPPGRAGRGGSDSPDAMPGEAKLAVTHWRVQRVGHGRTLMTVRLETGRKNQIRVHMAGMGHPIVGDRRYGAKTDPLGNVCLHAFELGFSNPLDGQSMRFRSPTPGGYFGLVGSGESMRRGNEFDHDVTSPMAAQRPMLDANAIRQNAPDLNPRTSDSLQPRVAEPAIDIQVSHASPTAGLDSSWDHVADWYDELIEERGSDHHQRVITPGTMRLIGDVRGKHVLDVACGQGVFCRVLAGLGARVVGVDASSKLIDAARRNARGGDTRYVVGDARNLPDDTGDTFDIATCVMALMNIDPLNPVLAGIAGRLRPGGVCVAVLLHPAFRAPGQTSWQWDAPSGTDAPRDRLPPGTQGGPGPREVRADRPSRANRQARQFRRVDGYLSLGHKAIVMNPGAAATGRQPVTTITYHRPVQSYVQAFAGAGLFVSGLEEWPSLRMSQPGPRAAEENRARREIPMFLAIRGVKV